MTYSLYFLDGIIRWLENHMMPCFYKKFFGIECPGCGMQRAFIELLKGNLWQSTKLYPALLPTLFLLCYLLLHLRYGFKNGARNLVWIFVINTIIVICNYISSLIK